MKKPTVALFTGDPAGIGPEIVAKVLGDPEVHAAVNLLIIGSRPILQEGMRVAGVQTAVADAGAEIPAGDHPPLMMEWPHIEADGFKLGEVTAESGRFMLDGLA